MLEVLKPFLVLLVGIVTGFLDSTTGGGGSISIPGLIFLGLPPQVAVATDRLGSIGQTLAALAKFWNSGKILWRYIPLFVVLSLVATYIGANILFNINPLVLQKLIGVVLLVLLPVTIMKREMGLKRVDVSGIRKLFGSIVYFLLIILNGFTGTGSGGISYYNSIYLFGFTFIESIATNVIPWFLLSVLSLVIYMKGGIVDIRNGPFLLVGMILGGYFGAHIALKKGELWIKRLFVIVVVASCIKLLFFS